MKKLNIQIESKLTFEDYKNLIDKLIQEKNIDKLKLADNYFEITDNYWIVDKYIVRNGQFSADIFPNTLNAYKESIKEGYAISIPVHMLDDETIVCFSHKNLSKVIPTTSGYLNNLSLKDIKDINLNDNNEKIPTLDEALEVINNQTPIIIDICNEGMIGKFEDKVLNSIQKYITKHDNYSNVAIMSVNPYTLQYCFSKFPYITRILKSGMFTEKTYGSIPTKKLKKLKLYKITHADFICYTADLLPSRYVSKHKPVGILANSVISQNQYINVAPNCDNILFNNFKPTI